VKFLLKNGADVNTLTNSGENSLYYACEHNNLDIVKLLLEKGVDVNVLSESGETALY